MVNANDVYCQIIANDGSPESLYLLTAAKDLFARQLPRMPKDYITRLVFDPNHCTILIRQVGARHPRYYELLPPNMRPREFSYEDSFTPAEMESRISAILGNEMAQKCSNQEYERFPGRVIGGIAVRPFTRAGQPELPHLDPEHPATIREGEDFGEIAFCAMEIDCQFTGLGSVMMAALKTVLAGHPLPMSSLGGANTPAPSFPTLASLRWLVTYADNNAVTFFKKCGFSQHITLRPALLEGRLKNYDGVTLMQCEIEGGRDYMTSAAELRELHTAHLGRLGICPRPAPARALTPLGGPGGVLEAAARTVARSLPLDEAAVFYEQYLRSCSAVLAQSMLGPAELSLDRLMQIRDGFMAMDPQGGWNRTSLLDTAVVGVKRVVGDVDDKQMEEIKAGFDMAFDLDLSHAKQAAAPGDITPEYGVAHGMVSDSLPLLRYYIYNAAKTLPKFEVIPPHQLIALTGASYNPSLLLPTPLETAHLCLALRRVIVYTLLLESTHDFHGPVSWSANPSYYARLADPICLLDMLARCDGGYYSTVAQFAADVGRMVKNCHLYNDNNDVADTGSEKGLVGSAAAAAAAAAADTDQELSDNDAESDRKPAAPNSPSPPPNILGEIDEVMAATRATAATSGTVRKRLRISDVAMRLGAVLVSLATEAASLLAQAKLIKHRSATLSDHTQRPVHACSASITYTKLLMMTRSSIAEHGLRDAVHGGAWQPVFTLEKKLSFLSQPVPFVNVTPATAAIAAIRSRMPLGWFGGLPTTLADELVRPDGPFPPLILPQSALTMFANQPTPLTISNRVDAIAAAAAAVVDRAGKLLGAHVLERMISVAEMFNEDEDTEGALAVSICCSEVVYRDMKERSTTLQATVRGYPAVTHCLFSSGSRIVQRTRRPPSIGEPIAGDRLLWDGGWVVTVSVARVWPGGRG